MSSRFIEPGAGARSSALEIAKYVITKCYDDGEPISNLKLQKILYYMQKEYINKFGRLLFKEMIEAWKFGPTIPAVYYKYSTYVCDNLYIRYPEIYEQLDFGLMEKSVLDSVIKDKRKFTEWELVGMTHKEKAWSDAYMAAVRIIDPVSMLSD